MLHLRNTVAFPPRDKMSHPILLAIAFDLWYTVRVMEDAMASTESYRKPLPDKFEIWRQYQTLERGYDSCMAALTQRLGMTDAQADSWLFHGYESK